MHHALDYVWELHSSGNGKRVSRQAFCIGKTLRDITGRWKKQSLKEQDCMTKPAIRRTSLSASNTNICCNDKFWMLQLEFYWYQTLHWPCFQEARTSVLHELFTLTQLLFTNRFSFQIKNWTQSFKIHTTPHANFQIAVAFLYETRVLETFSQFLLAFMKVPSFHCSIIKTDKSKLNKQLKTF